jgi:hypothetical protein
VTLTGPTAFSCSRISGVPHRGMTERYGCKLRPYIYVADVPNRSVDADAYGIFQPRA